MPTEVKRWLTTDGKEFPNEAEATAHENATEVLRLQPKWFSPGKDEAVAAYQALKQAFLHGHITRTPK